MSLRKQFLNVCCLQLIDGYRLETIFKLCEKLKKFVFLFEYIEHNDSGGTLIASISFQYSFTFKNDMCRKFTGCSFY